MIFNSLTITILNIYFIRLFLDSDFKSSIGILFLDIKYLSSNLSIIDKRRFLEKTRLIVIFLQETLVEVDKPRNFMFSLRLDWMTCVVSYVENFGGLLVSCNLTCFDLVPVLSCGGNFLTGSSLASKRKVSPLNVYGPCQNRKLFWEKVDRVGLLAVDDLIMAGDLNLTINSEEIWGEIAQVDSLASFFKELFSKNKLVDVALAEVVSTWRNDGTGS